jgi:hypothetical protein
MGPGIATISAPSVNVQTRSGLAFRLHYDKPIGENVFVRTSGSYFPGGANLSGSRWSREINLSYAETGAALVILGGGWVGGLELLVGPSLAYLVDAKLADGNTGRSVDVGQMFTDTSLGLNLGGALRIRSFVLGADYHLGLTDVFADPEFEGKIRVVRFLAGLSLPVD